VNLGGPADIWTNPQESVEKAHSVELTRRSRYYNLKRKKDKKEIFLFSLKRKGEGGEFKGGEGLEENATVLFEVEPGMRARSLKNHSPCSVDGGKRQRSTTIYELNRRRQCLEQVTAQKAKKYLEKRGDAQTEVKRGGG